MFGQDSLYSRKIRAVWARRIGLAAMVGLVSVAMLGTLDAEARRLGGSRSVGRQQSTLMQRQTPPAQPSQATQAQRAQAAPAPAPAPAATPNRSRWLGPIAGLAAGLGIAALLSHFGLGGAFAGAMANAIVIALIAFAAIWLIRRFAGRRRETVTPAYAAGVPGLGGAGMPRASGGEAPAAAAPYASTGFERDVPAAAPAVPAGFDTDAFLRSAKVYFVRLQAAWDAGNMEDIREFTTPEMFAEIRLDLDARGAQPNVTDVVQLDAELLGIEDRGSESLASVRFSGLIRETAGAAAEPSVEIWNLSKAAHRNEGWLLAGIQQPGNTPTVH
jgi:predicted lipid-binding transport protein (Tim44 family)